MTKYHISIDEIEVTALIGAYEYERSAPQKILINLDIRCDFSDAISSDSLSNALDYDQLIEMTKRIAENSTYVLLESLANEIRNQILNLRSVSGCTIRLQKPNISKFARSVSVQISD